MKCKVVSCQNEVTPPGTAYCKTHRKTRRERVKKFLGQTDPAVRRYKDRRRAKVKAWAKRMMQGTDPAALKFQARYRAANKRSSKAWTQRHWTRKLLTNRFNYAIDKGLIKKPKRCKKCKKIKTPIVAWNIQDNPLRCDAWLCWGCWYERQRKEITMR